MKVTIKVDDQLVNDAMESGLRSGIRYWCKEHYYRARESRKLSIRVIELDPDDHFARYINRKNLKAAMALMAYAYPHHFADLCGGRSDAITGDVLIQLAIFGEVKYG